MDMVTILVQATALMLVLIALRPLLKRCLSARVRCALWAIPVLRLLLPFELESSLSVMAPVQPVAQGVENVVSRPVTQISPSGWLGTATAPNVGHAAQNTVQNVVQNTAPVENTVQNAVASPELSLATILFALWLIGAVITGGIILYQNIRFYSGVNRLAEPYGKMEKLPVYLVKGLPSPCLAGVFRPRIYINEHALVSEEVLQMTLRHELTHYKRLDHIWNAVRGLLLALYWFHPLVWYCSELFRSDCETACDAAATRDMCKDERESYGMALITLASQGGKRDAGRLVCLSTMGGSKKLLKERITQLAKGRTFRFAAVIALLLSAVLCLTMCTVPHEDNDIIMPNTGEQSDADGENTPKQDDTTQNEESPEDTTLDIIEWDIAIYEPSLGMPGTLDDLVCCLELTVTDQSFVRMDEDEINGVVSEYEDLIDDYRFMGRVSEDGTIRYIVGEYTGDFENSGFYGLYSMETNDGNQFLYRPEDADAVEEDIFNGRTPEDGILLKNSRVTHFSRSSLILIQPNDSAVPLDGVCYRYVEGTNGRSYIMDAVSRGISVGATQEPYLEVYRISELYGEICERIALTEKEVEQILSEPLMKIRSGCGITATLHYNGESVLYSEFNGVPQTVIDLARSRCEYTFASPSDIEGKIVKATLECNWLHQPLYASEKDLPRLREILKGAKFGFVGACGYGAKLTIEMDNGETMVLFKGCDGCDSIVFGSYGGYFLGDKQNTEFWEMFGLDPDTKELLFYQQTIQNGFPIEMLFASGAGAWGTTLTLNLDGTFEGQYHDSNMGENGDEYPNGTVYYCNFSGRFGSMMKLNDYSYYMRLEELVYDTDIGREQIGEEEGIRYVTAEPYGIAGGVEFIFYLPGTPVDGLNEDFINWWPDAYEWRQGELDTLNGYGLYNVNTGDGFFSNWLA